MDGNNPKVSFIPKGSFAREESFFERRRPRSVLGILASALFSLSVLSYTALFYYNDSLNKEVAKKTNEITTAKNEFANEPRVIEAKVFRERADLARNLLNAHTVASPVFKFLSKNTLESILYDNFVFEDSPVGPMVGLAGEAQTYSALAYQTDVFRKQTKELLSFTVKDISLTQFGTVKFTIILVFNPNYLLYINNLSSLDNATSAGQQAIVPTTDVVEQLPVPKTPIQIATSTSNALPQPPLLESPARTVIGDFSTSTQQGVLPVSRNEGTSGEVTGSSTTLQKDATTNKTMPQEKKSFLQTLWAKFKFW